MFNAIAGILLAILSITSIFLGNALLFLLAALMFLRLHTKESTQDIKMAEYDSNKAYFTDLKEGLHFVKKKEILMLIIPFIILNLLLATFTVNLPAIAKLITGSAISYGLLLTMAGLGGVVGAMLSNVVTQRLKIGTIMISTVLFYGLCWLIGISLGGIFVYVFAFLASIFIGIINVIFTVLFQELPPENMLGRVNTTITTLITICMPLGALFGGWLPTLLGVKYATMLNASLIILLALVLLLLKDVRQLDISSS